MRSDQSPSADRPPGWRRREIAAGLKASLSAGLGMFPLGMAFGLLVVQSGLPWWVAPGLSIFGYAGSLELLLIGLITAGTALPTIALTTLLVNFRHVFYAFSFPLNAIRNPFARAYSVYALTDESYAVTAVRPETWTAPRLLAVQIAFQCYWVGGGLVGVLIASFIPFRIEGLEFALCALFITLTLDACRTRAELPSLMLGAVSFVAALLIVPDQALFAAMVIYLALLGIRFVAARQRGANA